MFGCNMTKEEFEEQQKFEENLIQKMIQKPPIEVVLGGKGAILKHLANMAVELYEETKKEDKNGL